MIPRSFHVFGDGSPNTFSLDSKTNLYSAFGDVTVVVLYTLLVLTFNGFGLSTLGKYANHPLDSLLFDSSVHEGGSHDIASELSLDMIIVSANEMLKKNR